MLCRGKAFGGISGSMNLIENNQSVLAFTSPFIPRMSAAPLLEGTYDYIIGYVPKSFEPLHVIHADNLLVCVLSSAPTRLSESKSLRSC